MFEQVRAIYYDIDSIELTDELSLENLGELMSFVGDKWSQMSRLWQEFPRTYEVPQDWQEEYDQFQEDIQRVNSMITEAYTA